jgi:hypothetical protein
LTGLETILISMASFVAGAIIGVVTFAVYFSQQFVQRTACEAVRSACAHRVEMERREIIAMAADIKELSRWTRMIAGKMNLDLPESDR